MKPPTQADGVEAPRGEEVGFPGDGPRDGDHVEERPGVGEGGDGLEGVLGDAEQRGGPREDPRVDHAVVDVPHLRARAHAAQLRLPQLAARDQHQPQEALRVRQEELARLDLVPGHRPSQRHRQFRKHRAAQAARHRGNPGLLAEKELRVRADQKRARGVHGDQRGRRFGDREVREPRGNVDHLAVGNVEGVDADLPTAAEFVEQSEPDRTIVGRQELEIANAQLVDVDIESVECHVEFVCERDELRKSQEPSPNFEGTNIEGK